MSTNGNAVNSVYTNSNYINTGDNVPQVYMGKEEEKLGPDDILDLEGPIPEKASKYDEEDLVWIFLFAKIYEKSTHPSNTTFAFIPSTKCK